MDKDKLVSIIIPVYNCEKYVEECINSLTSQSYNNIEIIAVNDGSKDNSADIISRLAEKDKRIKLINKDNGGVSSARNRGISEAGGEYIAFCDADDTYYPDGIKDLLSSLDDETELIVGSHDKEWIKLHSCKYDCAMLYKNNLYDDFLMYSDYFHFIWGNIYRAEIISNNNIQFDENISFSEDFDFNLKYIKCCNKLLRVSDKTVYHYYISRSSAHEKRDYPAKELNTIFNFYDGKENINKSLYYDIVSMYLIRNINRTYSWYNIRKTAEMVNMAFDECSEIINYDILVYAFGQQAAEMIIDGDYYSFVKQYVSDNKGMTYDKYRFMLSKLALKILKK